MASDAKAKLPRKSADDLRYLLALMLGIDSQSRQAKAIVIMPMRESWRAMSGGYDDHPDFRTSVFRQSIELAEQFDLDN